MIKAVLFDLDGTLLPMTQEKFVKAYFGSLAKRLAPYGFEPEALYAGIWAGMKAMILNNGAETNEARWWETFDGLFGEMAKKSRGEIEAYYKEDFGKVSLSCGHNPMARVVTDVLKEHGVRLVLATNPVFPATATYQRAGWAGLDTDDFELITTYENSHYCKPNLKYYIEICEKLKLDPNECLMVGNDVGDDMVAEALGMKVFLLTDCLINKTDRSVEEFPNGNFDKLIRYLEKLT
jgi:HAD superfamily hydrolase (TIGR01549 family)